MKKVGSWVNKRLGERSGEVVLLALLVGGYVAAYFGHELFPGVGPEATTRGWWTWSDQNRYRLESLAIAGWSLDAATYFYPIGYPLLGAVFVRWMPAHPFLIPDVLMVMVAGVAWWRIARRWLAPLAVPIVAVGFLLAHRWLVAQTMVIPWNTLPTQATLLTAIWLTLERSDGRAVLWVSFLASLTYLVRPIDAVSFAPLLVFGTLRQSSWQRRCAIGAAGLAIVAASVAGVAWLNLQVVGNWRTTYDVISTNVIGFFGYPISYKLFWLFVDGQPLFHEAEPALLFRYPWLFLLPMGLVFLVRIERAKGVAVLLALAANVLLYVNYNDLLPSDLYRFTLIHYLAWAFPLLFLFCAAAAARMWRDRAIQLGLCASLLLIGISAGLRLEPTVLSSESHRDRTIRLPEIRPLRLRFAGTQMEAVSGLRLSGHGLVEYSEYVGPYVKADLELLLSKHAVGTELSDIDRQMSWPPEISRYDWSWRLAPKRLKVWR